MQLVRSCADGLEESLSRVLGPSLSLEATASLPLAVKLCARYCLFLRRSVRLHEKYEIRSQYIG
jgi:hypothetical protein